MLKKLKQHFIFCRAKLAIFLFYTEIFITLYVIIFCTLS